jgi:hypothetical protein
MRRAVVVIYALNRKPNLEALLRQLRKIYLFHVFNNAGDVVPTYLPHCGSVFALIVALASAAWDRRDTFPEQSSF